MMTEAELQLATIGFRAGYQDAAVGGHFSLWLMMQQNTTTNAEMSDYWFGWHRGRKHQRRKR